jgi:O-antigen/teichoic acid export membrane protein
MLYREAGVFILGYILAPGQLGVFVVADKIARAFVSLSNPVTQTLFPEICSDRNARPGAAAKYLRWSFTGTAVGMTLLAAGVYALSGRIMPLVLGGMRAEAAGTLKILAAIIPLLSLSTVLGTQTLIPFHRERAMTAVLAGAGVCGIPVLILLAGSMGVYGAAWTVVLVESAVFLSLLGVVARYCPEAFFPRRRLDGGPQ